MISRKECRTMVGHYSLLTWMLVLITFASPILTQNNTCHRIESYEVEIMVPVREPVTFRSYTWCLKVPPRCSKYTVQYRERLTYETEVRNRTVTECCEGYVQLYSECVSKCSDCDNFHCNATTNQCTCLSGFIGNLCNETCEDGKWGDRCSEICTCRIGEDCNKASGVCTPKPTEDPEKQTLGTNTTVVTTDAYHLLSSQYSSATAENAILSTTTTRIITMNVATSQQSIPTPHVTTVENFITAEPIATPTNHSTAFFTTLPSTISTASIPDVENNSTEALTTMFNPKFIINSSVLSTSDTQSTLHSSVPSTFDTHSTLQTFFESDTVDSVLGKQIINNLTSTASVYNITSNIKAKVTEPEELPLNAKSWPSETMSTIKPQVTESSQKEMSSSTTFAHSEIVSTVKSRILKPTSKELLTSTSETVLSTLVIPQENYSKDINVSLESHPEFSLNTTMVYARWINEFSTNTSVTLAAALVLLVLVIVTTSVMVHCCSHKSSQLSNGKEVNEENASTLFSRNSHYDVPGPPTFSFINAYALELLTKDVSEANYDHPCSARCLVVNEPVYDELRY